MPRVAAEKAPGAAAEKATEVAVPLSDAGKEIRQYVSQPVTARKPVGYKRKFLGSYRPNETFYLSKAQRAHLAKVGQAEFLRPGPTVEPASEEHGSASRFNTF